jgi:hypothetical protein
MMKYKWLVEHWDDKLEAWMPYCKHQRFPRCEHKRMMEQQVPHIHVRKLYPGEDVRDVPTLAERLQTF